MRFFATIFLLFFYLFATAGVNVKVHYCGKKISGVKIFSVEESKCCCKKKTSKAKCCSEKQFQVKLNEVHSVASPEINIAPKVVAPTLFLLPIFFDAPTESEKIVYYNSNAPPLQKHQLHLLNSVFRI